MLITNASNPWQADYLCCDIYFLEIELYNEILHKMSNSKKQFVLNHPEGWAVKAANASKATVVVPTQKAAIEIARKIAKNQKAELTIQGRDGKFRAKDSYGNDPREIKG